MLFGIDVIFPYSWSVSGQGHWAKGQVVHWSKLVEDSLGLKIVCKFCGRLHKGWWGHSSCGKELFYSEDLNSFRREKAAGKNLYVAEMRALKRRRLGED